MSPHAAVRAVVPCLLLGLALSAQAQPEAPGSEARPGSAPVAPGDPGPAAPVGPTAPAGPSRPSVTVPAPIPALEAFGPADWGLDPNARRPSELPGETVLPWLLLSLLLFVGLRVASRVVRRTARERRRWAVIAARLWPLLEAAVWILVALAWIAKVLGSRSTPVVYAILAAVVLGVAVLWGALRDVAAGLVFVAERPFDVGEVVRVAGQEGQVRRLRLRFLEIETADGRRVQVPYREISGTTGVRAGGRRVAHAVVLDLELPVGFEPTEALRIAREIAASSPWAVLGLAPRVELSTTSEGRSVVRVEGFAFDAEVRSDLHADLLAGWREAVRGTVEPRAGER